MAWRMPGQNYTVEFEGRKVVCKSLSDGELNQLVHDIGEVKKGDIDGNLEFRDMLAKRIVSIEGFEGDVREMLGHQPIVFVDLLFAEVVAGNTLSEADSKNSDSSSK